MFDAAKQEKVPESTVPLPRDEFATSATRWKASKKESAAITVALNRGKLKQTKPIILLSRKK